MATMSNASRRPEGAEAPSSDESIPTPAVTREQKKPAAADRSPTRQEPGAKPGPPPLEIQLYDPGMRVEWDAFVRTHPQASYGHLSATFDLVETMKNVSNRSLLVREAGKLVGI